MQPFKIKKKIFYDNRGFLLEVTPDKLKKKIFVYSILTESKKNVLRGMHYNKKYNEEKLILVLKGKIFDVSVNLNKGKNFGRTFYNVLKKNDILFIPKGFAHGYQCLGQKNTVLYLLNKKFIKENNSGFSWNDKNFKIKWKMKNPVLSVKDAKLKEFKRK